MADIGVRTASPADASAVGAMLARAFDDDPVTRFLLPSGSRRAVQARRFFTWQLRRLIPQEQVHIAGENQGAALWALPGRWRESPAEGLSLLRRLPGPVVAHPLRLTRSIAVIERFHPPGAHLYLSVLGTEPSAQGSGFGSAAIAQGLALADAEGLSAYLESSKERNIDFYARFGFQVIEKLTLPGGGPALWPMWREPGGRMQCS